MKPRKPRPRTTIEAGRKGGFMRALNLTPERRSEIARNAVAAREAKRKAEREAALSKLSTPFVSYS